MPGGESALSRISSFKVMENKGSSVQQSMRSMRIAHGGSPSLLWPLVATYIIFRMLLLQSSCSREGLRIKALIFLLSR